VEWREVRASIRRHWPVALVLLLMIPVVMGIYLMRRDVVRPPARYTTSADVLIPARDEAGEVPEDVPPVLLQGQTELANAPETIDTALEAAGEERSLGINFSGRLNEDNSIITLAVSAPEPELAQRLLDEYTIAYREGRRMSVLDAAVELQDIHERVIGILNRRLSLVTSTLNARKVPLPAEAVPDGSTILLPAGTANEDILLAYERNSLLNERDRRRVAYAQQATIKAIPASFTTVVQVRSTARITPPPPSPLVPLLTILGVGLLIALAVPVAMDRLDSTITEARAAPGALRAGLLQRIPHLPRRLMHGFAPPGSTWELAFRSLAATSISTDRMPRAIMVTSPADSTQDAVAANFAAALAGLGLTVALVGTVPEQRWFLHDPDEGAIDDTGPAASGPVATPGEGGTALAVADFPTLLDDAQAARLVDDLRPRLGRRDIDNLYIIPPSEEPHELLLDGLPPLLEALTTSGIDITVIAGPPLLDDPQATIIAWSTRHVLWAVELGQVNKADAQLAADRLELAGVEPFGIALVNRRVPRT
jgi:hypothetical protein